MSIADHQDHDHGHDHDRGLEFDVRTLMSRRRALTLLAGPFPGDGSNGPNVLTESGIVRSDISSSFGSASGIAEECR